MGQTTPAIGIYIPAAGETNYDQAFAAGMVNIDQHDHSGGPNKGLPIATEGLGDFSVTFDKLNANVVDPTTGIGVSGAFPNQLVMLDPLKSLFQQAPASGFVTMDGTDTHIRTFADSASVTWTNADGVAGNPSATVNITGISPVLVANGGTSRTSFAAWDVICGGTTPTGALQQVSGEGTLNQYLGSNGAGQLPGWKTLPAAPAQNVLKASVVMTASQFRNLKGTPIQIVPAQGAGTVIVPITAYGKVQISSSGFGGGSAVFLYWGSAGTLETNVRFDSGTFDSSTSGYYLPTFTTPNTSVIDSADIENQGLYISVNSSNFTGGGTSTTVTIAVTYTVIQI